MHRGKKHSRKSDSNRERPSSIHGRVSGNRLPADNRQRQRMASGGIHTYDWRAWGNQFDFSVAWLSYKLSIVGISAATVGIGIGQIYVKLTGG